MNFIGFKRICLLTLTVVSLAAVAAPGTPIGGIVVKGGKNPGGQMAVLATTDSEGHFGIRLADRGEYRIEFDRKSNGALDQHNPGDMRLEYVLKKNDGQAADSKKNLSEVSRATHYSSDLNSIRILLYVPADHAELTGSFQAMSGRGDSPRAERAINESGVSVKPEKPKVRNKP